MWPLLDVVDEALRRAVAAAAGRAPAGTSRARRFAAVRHLAELFDRYALHRPELVRPGRRARTALAGASCGSACARASTRPTRPPGSAARARGCGRAGRSPSCRERLSLFGLTRLPAGQLRVLRALAARTATCTCSCCIRRRRCGSGSRRWRRASRAAPRTRRRRWPATGCWPPGGRTRASCSSSSGPDVAATSTRWSTRDAAGTPAGRRREDRRRRRAAARRRERGAAGPDDRSVEVHACHGRARQVEVLRDAILHLLEEDPTLEPRDVIVMCPDIETFAPLIQATFGAGESRRGRRARDAAGRHPPARPARAARRPLAAPDQPGARRRRAAARARRAAADRLAGARLRRPRAGPPSLPARRRRRSPALEDWVADSGIRWGLDADAPRAVQARGAARGHVARGARPAAGRRDDDRGATSGCSAACCRWTTSRAGAIDLAGRFAELIDRLRAARRRAAACRRPSTSWAADARARAADALTATAPRDSWQRAELQRLLDDVVARGRGPSGASSSSAEIRALLADRLQGRPTRANFRTGHLTICTLVPMRSVPHRVVCLLGLDDGAFPRKAPRDGDDLLLADPHVGDRDSRTEDRQLLLDALMAATRPADHHLHRQRRAHEHRRARRRCRSGSCWTWSTHGGREPLAAVVRHPLQPFDPRNFIPGALVAEQAVELRPRHAGGRAGARRPRGCRARPFLEAPLPARPPGPIELARPRALRRASGARVPAPAARGQRRRLLRRGRRRAAGRARRAGAVGRRPAAARRGLGGTRWAHARCRAEIARGQAPAGPARQARGGRDLAAAWTRSRAQAQALIAGEARSVDVKVEVAGRRVTGTVPGVRGSVLATVTYSKVNPRHRIGAWVRLLALCATGEPYSSATIGRARRARHGRRHGRAGRRRSAREDALAQLAVLSISTTAGCASRCRSPAATSARVRRGRQRARRVGVATASRRRTASPSTSSSTASSRLVRVAAGGGAARRRALGPGGAHALRPVRAAAVARAAGARGDRASMSRPFDVCGPLPTGITVLEASAGPARRTRSRRSRPATSPRACRSSQLLLVTFTRMATGELRDRVRERLVSRGARAERVWRAAVAADDVVRLLAEAPREEVRGAPRAAGAGAGGLRLGHDRHHPRLLPGGARRPRRRGRRRAGRRRSSRTRRPRRRGRRRPLRAPLHDRRRAAASRARQALQIARAAVDNPVAPIEPRDAARRQPGRRCAPGSPRRVRRGARARASGALSVITYDDLLTRLRRRRSRGRRGTVRGAAAGALPGRARRRVPGHRPGPVGHPATRVRRPAASTLVLIGDPKQAIYAFRGADVYAYLEAAKTAGEHRRRS